ncbi:hypothetical protein M408DRAFT_27637 [Serendipita vermifera MAFF 305830]|uniref:CHAT domain-containing protein n=1 Tax=Serendipita vermifera MAFF 305830 TaxID=933852 RepID=A0A0C3AGA9_SERVB|nr:hypothetical protein M408DRAFT_27637 [Serendipita vermifera MAFF 305830]
MDPTRDEGLIDVVDPFPGSSAYNLLNSIRLAPIGHPIRPLLMKSLGDVLLDRFRSFGEFDDCDGAVSSYQTAVDLTSNDHPSKLSMLIGLGDALLERFEETADLSDCDLSTRTYNSAIESMPTGHPDMHFVLSKLADAFLARFDENKEVEDCSKAIQIYEEVLALLPMGHRCRPSAINDLAISFQSRFEHGSSLGDLQKAISYRQAAIELTRDGNPDKSIMLNRLGDAFSSKYKDSHDNVDCDAAISSYDAAVRLASNDDPERPPMLDDLAMSLLDRFERYNDRNDCDNAISSLREAVSLTSNDDCDKHLWFNHLGSISNYESAIEHSPNRDLSRERISLSSAHLTQFNYFGEKIDTERAISHINTAMQFGAVNDWEKIDLLDVLGRIYSARFERFGEHSDSGNAMSAYQNGIELAKDRPVEQFAFQTNLGVLFIRIFKRLGHVDDCNSGIAAYNAALNVVRHDDPARATILSGLGYALLTRFERLGHIADCEEAISYLQSGISVPPSNLIDRAGWLNNLGITLWPDSSTSVLSTIVKPPYYICKLQPNSSVTHPTKLSIFTNLGQSYLARFERLRHLVDCDTAITNFCIAVRLSTGSFDEAAKLCDLGNALVARVEYLEDSAILADHDTAVSTLQCAVDLTPEGHPLMAARQQNLAISLILRFDCSGQCQDADYAIQMMEEVLKVTPHDYPDKPAWLANMGHSHLRRFERLGNKLDLERTALEYSNSAQSTIGPYSSRFLAATNWARCEARLSNPSSSLTAYSRALYLLPRVAWKGIPMGDRYNELARMGILVREAVAAAISAGKLEIALEWLEQGRSIVWGQILQLRTPLDELQTLYPELAKALKRISSGLERKTSYTSSSSIDELIGMEERGKKYRDLTREWEQTVDQVRSKPEFEDFLRPKTLAKLSSAIRDSPIVVLNVHQNRCDALIFVKNATSDSSMVLHVPLDGLLQHVDQLHHDINRLASTFRTQGFSERASIRVREREDDEARMKSILAVLWERVAQPVLQKLELPAQPKKLPRIWWCATGALAFLPIHAAGLYDTDIVGSKLSDYAISSYTPTVTALLERPNAVKDKKFGLLAVLQPSTPNADPCQTRRKNGLAFRNILEICRLYASWLHLACHGVQNVHKSAFLLEDGPLELSEIVKEDFPNAEFAFLSACQTSAGDKKLSEEAVHLAAGMLLSGYRSVVATMWSIRDKDAPFVADVVYTHLLKDGQPDYTRAASALHDAIQKLSQQPGVSLLSWVPFIHMGH